MIASHDCDNLHKIVILNPKGGCGKTTLATNLASCYALRGPAPTLVDCDPQGFSMRWLDQRPANRPKIYGVSAHEGVDHIAASLRHYVHAESETVIFDLPANIERDEFHSLTYDANSVLIPVMPSAIDVFSASRFIADLLVLSQFDRRDRQLAVIANRTRQNTKSLRMLMRFLTSLRIPIITALRDSQNYVQAAAQGIGISELPPHKTQKDLVQINLLLSWLDQWRMRRLDVLASSEYEHIKGTAVLTPVHEKVLR